MSASPVVVDAGFAVHQVVATPVSPVMARVWEQLLRDEVPMYAPRLWRYEVTSAIHKYAYAGLLTSEEGERALQTAWELGVDLVSEDDGLCLAALRWATRLRQRVTYDAFYLALAERIGAELWTTDRRLYHAARDLGVRWVCTVEDA
jgi:predicted nucleic acid-binding protein